MGRLIVSAQMSLDGVMDPVDDWFDATFEARAYGTEVDIGPSPLPHTLDQLRTADALVLGRKTYEGLSTVWPTMADPYGFADRINAMPKFVASRTLQSPLRWESTLIEGDVTEKVAELKAASTGNLISYGCGELASTLARAGLVDEIQLRVHPVVWGEGLRPLAAGETPLQLRLISANTFSSGVVLLTYQPLP